MSSNHAGFDSRCCFCLWSQGDPSRAIRDNHKTYLHPLWRESHFYVEVEFEDEEEEIELRFSFCRVLWSITAYPLGMIGYLVDTVLKVVMLIGNFIIFMIALFSLHSEWRNERGTLLLDNLAAIGIGLIGIIAPPLAYRLDKLAKDRFLEILND